MKFKNYISKIAFLIILTFFLLSKLTGQNAKRDNIYKHEDPGSFIDGSDITHSSYLFTRDSFKKANELVLPTNLEKYKGKIRIYIKFNPDTICSISDVYIISVILASKDDSINYNIDLNTLNEALSKKENIEYPQEITKVLPYVKKWVNALDFYLLDINKPPVLFCIGFIRIPSIKF